MTYLNFKMYSSETDHALIVACLRLKAHKTPKVKPSPKYKYQI